jgi:hypothetical protein
MNNRLDFIKSNIVMDQKTKKSLNNNVISNKKEFLKFYESLDIGSKLDNGRQHLEYLIFHSYLDDHTNFHLLVVDCYNETRRDVIISRKILEDCDAVSKGILFKKLFMCSMSNFDMMKVFKNTKY